MTYAAFLDSKARKVGAAGFHVDVSAPWLFPFQRACVRWALARGKAALFLDTGLGKTRCLLEWAVNIVEQTKGRVLILAPLAVTKQTKREADAIGIDVTAARFDDGSAIIVTNYELLEKFEPANFAGIVLDESGILRDFTGKTRNALIAAFRETPYKLCCTATPAPNDFTELGNHAEFLGVMTRAEMLSMFFCHDGGSTQDWRVKGHAVEPFWRWVCEWAAVIRNPADLGFDGTPYKLPPLRYVQHLLKGKSAPAKGHLFHGMAPIGLSERRGARRESIDEKVEIVRALAADGEPLIVWCGLNAEADACEAAIPGAKQVSGSDDLAVKEAILDEFSKGTLKVLVTKPSITGRGLNWQHVARMAFVGMSDSFEEHYQAVRRCWRFGQKKPVTVHLLVSEPELAVVANVERKAADFEAMGAAVVEHTKETVAHMLAPQAAATQGDAYMEAIQVGKDGDWTMHLGDCVEGVRKLDDASIDYSIFSPPFASLYTYSASERDMGNCADQDEFAKHFGYLIAELVRVVKPGRLVSAHCMNLPTSKARDGVIGITDFRGNLIRAFQQYGWIFHSEVCIWKDPVTAMQRTKALGLLHKQLKKDACMSRQGIPDYVVTMRKPGVNLSPVTNTNESFPVGEWQQYASPIWMDINPSETLQARSARSEEDERHICPLQLEVIRRCLRLWTKPGDLVLSPFAGIGSEGFESIKAARRFVGFELKQSYFEQACLNLQRAATEARSLTLFGRTDALATPHKPDVPVALPAEPY